jgi:hypothetical protein
LFCTVVALSLATSLHAQTVPGQAKVRAVKGSAVYALPGGASQPLKQGMTIASGTTIKTGAGSTVDLYLGKTAGVVRVTENTTLAIDRFNFTNTGAEPVVDLQLNLPEGTILGNVQKLSGASKYEIKLPNGVAGVRGTKFRISHTGYIVVIEGRIVFVYADPTTGKLTPYEIPPRHYYSPVEGVKPLPENLFYEINRQIPGFAASGREAETFAVPPPEIPGTEPIISPGSGTISR